MNNYNKLLITPLKRNIFEYPFLLRGENIKRTSIPNFSSYFQVFELQRLVTKWYLDFICILYIYYNITIRT